MTERKATKKDAVTIPAKERKEIVNIIIGGFAENLAARTHGRKTLPPDTAVVIHEEGTDAIAAEITYIRPGGVVQRAMKVLESWKFQAASIRGSRLPVDIIALGADVDMLVQVISSRHPIPDAKTLVAKYRKKIDSIRQMGTAARFRKILMAHSVPCGWKHYDVLPGGLVPAWDLHKLPTG